MKKNKKPMETCLECEMEGSSACCNPGGRNCLCAACETGEYDREKEARGED